MHNGVVSRQIHCFIVQTHCNSMHAWKLILQPAYLWGNLFTTCRWRNWATVQKIVDQTTAYRPTAQCWCCCKVWLSDWSHHWGVEFLKPLNLHPSLALTGNRSGMSVTDLHWRVIIHHPLPWHRASHMYPTLHHSSCVSLSFIMENHH